MVTTLGWEGRGEFMCVCVCVRVCVCPTYSFTVQTIDHKPVLHPVFPPLQPNPKLQLLFS